MAPLAHGGRPEIIQQIRVEARKQGVNERLAVAVAQVESNLNPRAKGSKGEIGLFQLMPYQGDNLWNQKNNIQLGLQILKGCLKNIMQDPKVKRDSPPYGVICYNQGPSRHPKYPLLHPYYKRVVAAMALLHKEPSDVNYTAHTYPHM